MGVGLRILNDGGAIQIDQDYISMALSAKGTCSMTLDPATHPQPMRIGQVTVTGVNPIIAFAPSGIMVNLLHQKTVGNQHTFYFRTRSNSDFTFPYWIFDNAAQGIGVGGNMGVRVFRSDGSLAWDAATKPLRVTGVIDLQPPAEGAGVSGRGLYGPEGSVTVPAGRTYALVQGSFCYVPVNYDDGIIYGTGGGMEEYPGDPGDPGGGGGGRDPTGKYQVMQGYHSAGGIYPGEVRAGLVQFEHFRGETSLYADEFSRTYGDLMFWAVDVTNY